MRKSSAPLRFKIIVLCLLALPGVAAMKRSHPVDRAIERKTEANHPVLVGGFAALDGDCHPKRVDVVEVPAHGRVVPHPEVVVDERGCTDAAADGPQVVYVPQDGFIGPDRFVLDAEYPQHRIVHARVSIDVGDGGGAKLSADSRITPR